MVSWFRRDLQGLLALATVRRTTVSESFFTPGLYARERVISFLHSTSADPALMISSTSTPRPLRILLARRPSWWSSERREGNLHALGTPDLKALDQLISHPSPLIGMLTSDERRKGGETRMPTPCIRHARRAVTMTSLDMNQQFFWVCRIDVTND